MLQNIYQTKRKRKIDTLEGCLDFKKKCETSKKKLKKKIEIILKKGKNIAGYAATSKSTTILNYCGINDKHIDFICDTTPDKIDKYNPGTHIPIVSIDHYRKNIPDYTFLLPGITRMKFLKREKKI